MADTPTGQRQRLGWENSTRALLFFSSSTVDLEASASPLSRPRRAVTPDTSFHKTGADTGGQNMPPFAPVSLRFSAGTFHRPEPGLEENRPGLGSGSTDQRLRGSTPGRPALGRLDSDTPVLPGLAGCGAATPVPSNACDDGLTRLQASTMQPPPCAGLSSAVLLGLWGGGHILSTGPWKAALTPSMTSKLLPFRGSSSSERHYIGLGGCLS